MITARLNEADHTYTIGENPADATTAILTALRLTPPYPEDRGALAFGTAVHRCCDLAVWDRWDRSRTSLALIPHVEGFLEKKQELRIIPIKSEMIVFDPVAHTAGKLDLFCYIHDAELALFDYKTGRPPNCVELQTASYVHQMYAMKKAGQLEPRLATLLPEDPASIRRFSMELTPGRAIMREYRDRYDFTGWEGAVQLFRWKQRRS